MKFFAPWCGHCQEMAADWEELGESIRDKPLPGTDLTIAEVNCVDNPLLCLKQGVDSYPTIKLYQPDGSVEDFLYARVLLRMKVPKGFPGLPVGSPGVSTVSLI